MVLVSTADKREGLLNTTSRFIANADQPHRELHNVEEMAKVQKALELHEDCSVVASQNIDRGHWW